MKLNNFFQYKRFKLGKGNIIQKIYFGFLRWLVRKKYPNWRKIFKKDHTFWKNSINSAKKGPKILISATIGIHPSVIVLEGYLGMALTLRGADVYYLLCDEFLLGCQVHSFNKMDIISEKWNPKRLCRKCFNPGYKSFSSTGLPVLKYSENITSGEFQKAEDISKNLDIKDIANFSIDGFNIGEHIMAGALKFFARGTLENEPYAEKVLRQYLKSSILTAYVINHLIDTHHFDCAVFHHGIYVPEGVIGEVCRKKGVRVVNWNPAYRKQCFIFSHRDTYHHTLMSEPTEKWENIKWNSKIEKEITDYLESRTTGGKDWISFVGKNPEFDLTKISQELGGIDFSKPCIGMLTNVIWDAQLHYPANIFKNMVEWIIKTIKYFSKRQDLQLIIRIHPAEILGELPSRQQVLDEIKKEFPNLPPNIFIIKPESSISTYAVMEQCNAVIIYGTKSGVELTSRGIPVIVAGEAWIRNKGLTIDPKSQDEYFKVLDQLPLPQKMSEEQIKRAKKYAFHFFYRRMIPVSQIEITGSIPPFKVKISNINKMLPGNDIGLDVICNGILKGTDFIYPAEVLLTEG